MGIFGALGAIEYTTAKIIIGLICLVLADSLRDAVMYLLNYFPRHAHRRVCNKIDFPFLDFVKNRYIKPSKEINKDSDFYTKIQIAKIEFNKIELTGWGKLYYDSIPKEAKDKSMACYLAKQF